MESLSHNPTNKFTLNPICATFDRTDQSYIFICRHLIIIWPYKGCPKKCKNRFCVKIGLPIKNYYKTDLPKNPI